MYTRRPTGFWYPHEKELYNLDGSIKEDYKERLLAKGKSIEDIIGMENSLKRELAAYNARVKHIEENFGVSYEEWEKDAYGIPDPKPKSFWD